MPGDVVNLQETARRLLEDGNVEAVIGYARGSQPLTATPVFVREPEDTVRLIFDRTCEGNLANYLRRFKDSKVAIVAKGCDERSIVGLVQEQQIRREELVVLGAPCCGVIDPGQVAKVTDLDGASGVEITEDTVRIAHGEAEPTALAIEDAVYAGCKVCPVRNPRSADYLIAEPVPQPNVPEFSPEVEAAENVSAAERWKTFSREMDKCILCFACRNLCPACYCNACFTDCSQPKWMSKTDDPADVAFFHLTRLLHLTGRCTGCGACVRGCPVNVDLRLYNDKLRKEVKDVFGFEAGMDPDEDPPMMAFRQDDKNDFIM